MMLKILSSIFYLWIINAFFSSLFTPKDHSPKIRWGIWVLFYLSHFFYIVQRKTSHLELHHWIYANFHSLHFIIQRQL